MAVVSYNVEVINITSKLRNIVADTLALYNSALNYVCDVVLNHYDELSNMKNLEARMYLEHLIHGIKFKEPKKEIIKNEINLIKEIPFFSLDIDEFKTLILTDEKVFGSKAHISSKYKLSVETKRLKSISELKIGDYVVHADYGIGKFIETKTMTLGNHTNDYIHIQYAGDQSVYILVENLYVLSKYAGSESYVPKLSSLNTKEWAKTKASAKKKVQELATRLLNLYSIREKVEGFKYSKDDETQKEFESEFKYELTKDQAQAIKDVKDDMESDKAMDRLICGDVGFGKTEVALRAAFKAASIQKINLQLKPVTK